MLVEYKWNRRIYKYSILLKVKYYKGWFLFGIIPLFIKHTSTMDYEHSVES